MRAEKLFIGFVFIAVAAAGLFVIYPTSGSQVQGQANVTSTEILSQGCEAEISNTTTTTTRMSSEPTFTSTIWNVSADGEMSTSIKKVEEGHFEIHVETQSTTEDSGKQAQCSGRYGIHYQLQANLPTNSEDLVVRLIENDKEAACGYSSSSGENLCW